MNSTIAFCTTLSRTPDRLAQLDLELTERAIVRALLATAGEALAELEAALIRRHVAIDEPVRRAYHAALALAAADDEAIRATAARMLDVLGPLVRPAASAPSEATFRATRR